MITAGAKLIQYEKDTFLVEEIVAVTVGLDDDGDDVMLIWLRRDDAAHEYPYDESAHLAFVEAWNRILFHQ